MDIEEHIGDDDQTYGQRNGKGTARQVKQSQATHLIYKISRAEANMARFVVGLESINLGDTKSTIDRVKRVATLGGECVSKLDVWMNHGDESLGFCWVRLLVDQSISMCSAYSCSRSREVDDGQSDRQRFGSGVA